MASASQIKLTIIGATDNDLQEVLRSAGYQPTSVPAAELPALAKSAAAPPDVVVVDLRQSANVPAAVADLTRRHPTIGVVIVAARLDAALMLEALNAGAKGFVNDPLSRQDLEVAISRVTQQAPPVSGQVIAFVGAKGGVGTTTVAVNTATALAKKSRSGTLLLDLNVRFGDAAAYLGVEPRFTVADALENAHRLDDAFVRGLVVRTPGGLDLLAAPERLPGPGIDLDRLRALLEFSKKHFGFTVVDVPRTDPGVLEALDSATHVVVVVSQELTAVRSATRLVKSLRQRYGKGRVKVILGRSDTDAEIAPEDLEKVLETTVRAFPNDYRRSLEALNRGRPLVLENHSKLAGEMQRFVKELTGATEAEPAAQESRSLFSKWLKGGSPS